MKEPRFKIIKSSQLNGLARYRVQFDCGIPFEFLIQAKPRRKHREWNVLFAREVAATLVKWADYHSK